LSLGAVYTIFAGFYNYWFLFTSMNLYNDYIGRVTFIWFFISSNLIFFSMHSLGIFGFPRRIYDYPVLYFKFQWMNSFGIIGVIFSMVFLVSSFVM
jgi:cytochrome c oxidase subunit 1